MKRVLVSDNISKTGLKCLLDAEDVEVDIKTDLSPDELKSIIGNYHGLLVRSQIRLPQPIYLAA
jgi:D-3-phosphoglycerate dehydrogenase